MEALRVLLPVFGVFIPALMLPGPDFIGVVRSSMTRGTGGGLRTAAGVSTGLGLYAALSLVGLSAVLVEYQWLSWVIRVLGGLYLVYLGVRLVAARGEQAQVQKVGVQKVGVQKAGVQKVPRQKAGAERLAADGGDGAMAGVPVRGNPFVFGFLVTLTNPKAIVLFASVFATAVTGRTPLWLMAVMVGLVMGSALGWYSLVSVFMSSAPVMRRFRHARHRIERVAGVCFVAVGALRCCGVVLLRRLGGEYCAVCADTLEDRFGEIEALHVPGACGAQYFDLIAVFDAFDDDFDADLVAQRQDAGDDG
jgi:threonine efflux protein